MPRKVTLSNLIFVGTGFPLLSTSIMVVLMESIADTVDGVKVASIKKSTKIS